jgi:hypothetical protein
LLLTQSWRWAQGLQPSHHHRPLALLLPLLLLCWPPPCEHMPQPGWGQSLVRTAQLLGQVVPEQHWRLRRRRPGLHLMLQPVLRVLPASCWPWCWAAVAHSGRRQELCAALRLLSLTPLLSCRVEELPAQQQHQMQVLLM